ncbi:hypothetical protein B0G62_1379 [Paraburkholderia eburnea]|uniref:Uncharacterized protein n=1 Tax=Paraburkholderia eburnea TaxID=1189126 RepID=A0A2S4LS72_9BURK|nr:hypothetical protein B0G62_1379 [Paraburkholderia eburnea]PRZ12744.1 hypothetical protein BX588_1359 [Paraburkholderia eburnea]
MTPGTSCSWFASHREYGCHPYRTGFYLRDERKVSVTATLAYIRTVLNTSSP